MTVRTFRRRCSHEPNGVAEAVVDGLEGLTRTGKIASEEAVGVPLSSTSPVLS